MWNADTLFGLGWQTNETSGEVLGLKLSMFDVKDPANASEIKSKVIRGIDGCSALDNYKALLIDPEKNLIGFAAYTYSDYTDTASQNYFLFSYKGGTFQKQLTIRLDEQERADQTRGLFIGDVFYLVTNEQVTAYDMNRQYQSLDSVAL